MHVPHRSHHRCKLQSGRQKLVTGSLDGTVPCQNYVHSPSLADVVGGLILACEAWPEGRRRDLMGAAWRCLWHGLRTPSR